MCIEYVRDILEYRIRRELFAMLDLVIFCTLVILWTSRQGSNASKKKANSRKTRKYMIFLLLFAYICVGGHDILLALNDYRNNNIVCNEGIYVNRPNVSATLFGSPVEFTVDGETIKLETYCVDVVAFPDGTYSATACYTENSRILLDLYDLEEIKMDDQS